MPNVLSRWTRAALLATVALIGGCETTDPGSFLVANLAIAPRFQVAAAAVNVDQARIQVLRTEGRSVPETVIDTTIAFPAAAPSLTVSLKIPLIARTENFTVIIDLSAVGVRYYSATEVVTVVENSSGGPATPTFEFAYVGPGANVTTVQIAPRDTSITMGDAFTFRLTGRNSQGQTVTGFPVDWATTDAQVAISTAGAIQAPNKRATIRVAATLPSGVTDTVNVTFVPKPTSLEVTAGNGQSGSPGTPLSQRMVVLVKAADGLPLAGVTVAFRAASGGGTVDDETAVTNASGLASTTLNLGPALGANQFEATVTGLPPVTVAATAVVGSAARLRYFGGGGQLVPSSRPFPAPLVVEVTDAAGFPVSGATVNWSITPGGTGTLGALTTQTNALGRAAMTPTAGALTGTTIYNAVIPGVAGAQVRFPSTTVPGAPTSVQIYSGFNEPLQFQSGSSSLEVRVTDDAGNPVPQVFVVWQIVTASGGSLAVENNLTDAFGVSLATYNYLTPSSPPVVIRASIASGANASFSLFSPQEGTPVLRLVREQGDRQSAPVGQELTESVMAVLLNQYGGPFTGIPVIWETVYGGGTLTVPTTTTGSSGETDATYRLSNVAGPKMIRVRHTDGAFLNFGAIALPGAPVAMLMADGDNQTASQGSTLSTQLEVIVLDQFNNPVPNVVVSWSRVTGGSIGNTTTDAYGFARISAALGQSIGQQQFQATISGGITAIFNATSTPPTVRAP